MKTKALIACLLLLGCTALHAQSHNTNCMHCRYSKSAQGTAGPGASSGAKGSEECGCSVCEGQKKKEHAAKLAEKKQQDDARNAQIEAERIARDKAFIAERERKKEEASKAKSGEVVINAQSHSSGDEVVTKMPVNTVIKKSSKTKSKLFSLVKNKGLNNDIYHIYNEHGDTIVKSNVIRAESWDKNVDIPVNVIIVQDFEQYAKGKYKSMTRYGYYNLMNSNGEMLLKEEKINYIKYCGSNFFIYTYDDGTGLDSNMDPYDFKIGQECGTKMVLFDIELNKKYYFEPNNEFGENKSYCVYVFPDTKSDEMLFRFSHFIRKERFGGEYEHYYISPDRQVVRVGLKEDRY